MNSEKLWSGRFAKDTAAAVHAFNRSIDFDFRLYAQDIRGSQAHAAMLHKVGLLSAAEAAAIAEGLEAIRADIEAGRLAPDPAAEDIHMFVEAELTRRIGAAGKKLHTGRSRNDQVALDLRLYMRDEAALIRAEIASLVFCLLDMAEAHCETVMPGYTHLQRAQPLTFAHHLMAYVEMFLRDLARLKDAVGRLNYCPLGAAALAGTTFPLDRAYVAELLDFDGICANSIDAVADRDFAVEIVACLALFMVHLSRLAEEIVLWNSREFAFIELDDAYATGSSIMPQKKNPDVAELARGKSARLIGDLSALLSLMKSLPLAYNKDMQEDKAAVFSALDTLKLTLPPFVGMLGSMKVRAARLREAAAGGFTNATEVADYLVGKGLPFREAHHISGRLVAFCLERGCALEDLSLEDFRGFAPCFEADIFAAIDLGKAVARRSLPGGPAPQTERAAIADARERLARLLAE